MSTPTDLIFSEDFEAYNYFEDEGDIVELETGGWVLYDEDGDGRNWYVFPSEFYTKVATSASWATSALTPENWLVSPAIDLSDYTDETISLEYRVYGQDPDWANEHYKVVVSTTDNLVASFIDANIVAEETIGDGIYFRNVDLSDFAGEVIYLAFVHYDITDMYRINFDKIQVYAGDVFSAAAEIEEFSFVEEPEALVEIDGTDILVTVAAGTDITALTPTMTISAGATIEMLSATSTLSKMSGFEPIDFTEPVEFLVTAENGIEFNIYTVTVDFETSVEEPAVISNLNVYPNPFTNEIRIANAENVTRITITNLIGQVVVDMPYRGETTINTSNLNNGLYLVVFQSENGQRVVRKMIKQ